MPPIVSSPGQAAQARGPRAITDELDRHEDARGRMSSLFLARDGDSTSQGHYWHDYGLRNTAESLPRMKNIQKHLSEYLDSLLTLESEGIPL